MDYYEVISFKVPLGKKPGRAIIGKTEERLDQRGMKRGIGGTAKNGPCTS